MSSKSISFIFVSIALFAGLLLSIASFFHICMEACRAGESWAFFNIPLPPLGILYFSTLLIFHIGKKTEFVGKGLAAGLGAEVVFIAIQKFMIGHWCPLCLGVAFFLAAALVTYLKKENLMQKISTYIFFVLGIVIFGLGMHETNPLQAEEVKLQDKLYLGNASSPLVAYLFTDWGCETCKELEPRLPPIAALLLERTKLFFMDIAIHPITRNYSPYNLSFIIHNKAQYLKLRDALTKLAETKEEPNDEDMKKMAAANGTQFTELPYGQVASGLKFWEDTRSSLNVRQTPTLVIINTKTKNEKSLVGADITVENVRKALEDLKGA